jgi:hypothetical protein
MLHASAAPAGFRGSLALAWSDSQSTILMWSSVGRGACNMRCGNVPKPLLAMDSSTVSKIFYSGYIVYNTL